MDIEILIKDSSYTKYLVKNLNKYYGIKSTIINSFDEYDSRKVLVTDQNLDILSVNLYNDKLKYQSIDKIKELIDYIIEKKKESEKVPLIISILNLSSLTNHNQMVQQIYDLFPKDKKRLVVNFNYFYKYYEQNEITIDNLIFSNEESNISTNSFSKFSYLSASKLPVVINKKEYYIKVMEKIKKLKFDYIFMDITFAISNKNIHIINESDVVIYHETQNGDAEYIYSTKEFLNKILKNQHIYLINESKKTVKIKSIKEEEFFDNLEEFIKNLCLIQKK
ncbi:MAG: hypothetical protein Q4B23_02970 [Helcococcus sp.]|nr:hypothetical protein [Helcococcus sp.]